MATATRPLPAMSQALNGTHGPAASPDEPTAILTTVTPQMATDWLAAAHPNRPPSRARVKTIARAIAAGLWETNGGTLVLCPEFRLLDGRHRCLAIVDAGRSVQTFVVCGIDPLCFATMDQGGEALGRRCAGDCWESACPNPGLGAQVVLAVRAPTDVGGHDPAAGL